MRALSEPGGLGALRRRECHHPLGGDGLGLALPGSVRDELQRFGCKQRHNLLKRATGCRLRLLPSPAPAGRQLPGLFGRLAEPAVEGLVVSLVAESEDTPPAVRRKPLRRTQPARWFSLLLASPAKTWPEVELQ